MLSRRDLLKVGALGAAALIVPWPTRSGWSWLADLPDILPASGIRKYAAPLLVPPVMPMKRGTEGGDIDQYVIAVRQFRQQILPPGLPPTTVWGFGPIDRPKAFNAPSLTIEATVDRPVRVRWINDLVDGNGRFRPHLLPVDPTLHWANPGGGPAGRDTRPTFDATPGPYRGPVPFVVHLHGGHSREEFDGYAEAWFLPAARDIPRGYARVGSWYERFGEQAHDRLDVPWPVGQAVFQYDNDQRASTLWFHDHTLGMTRLNVYAGPAGFYLLRGGASDLPDGVLPGPAPRAGDGAGVAYHEIPIAIQDRTFQPDGRLFFPASRTYFGDVSPDDPFIPDSDVSPIWNPEFFGTTMMVNGRTWPTLTVEPRRYRFRILNGCNSRFLILRIAADPLAERPTPSALPFWQVGSEGGFMPQPVELETLLVGLAERADVVVDFSGLTPGTRLYLINEGPDEPFGGGTVGVDFQAADPTTTGQVMRFEVGPLLGPDTSTPPDELATPTFVPLGGATVRRQVSLNEVESGQVEGAPTEALLGTVAADGRGVPYLWMDEVTERIQLGATEEWAIHNFTADAHPVHIHEVMFQVLGRGPLAGGAPRGPEAWEQGFKDTVIAYPDEITRLKARFDHAGRYVWHCHIVDHEDNEMMRPLDVEG